MHIPGVLTIFEPEADAIPVMVDSPHSGRDYPAGFLDKPGLERFEDRFVDQLIADFPKMGASVITALAPRIFIDLNRARNDINPALLTDSWPGEPLRPSDYSAGGIGLIWQYLDKRPIYPHGLTSAEVIARIEEFYDPYYKALDDCGARLEREFGEFYHLNMHSMPTTIDADIVLGNQYGKSCSYEFLSVLEKAFRAEGIRHIARNKPYAGAALTRVFSDQHATAKACRLKSTARCILRALISILKNSRRYSVF